MKHVNVDKEKEKVNLAKDNNATEDLLEILLLEKNHNVSISIAGNKNASEQILEKISNDKDWRVRVEVAKNPNTSNKVLKNLAHYKVDIVRMAVLANFRVKHSPDILAELTNIVKLQLDK